MNEASIFKLPTQKQIRDDFGELPRGIVWIVYGAPKTGKTFFCSTFPEPLILEFDPRGAENVSGAYVRHFSKYELDLIEKRLPEMVRNADIYRTVVLDTIDTLGRWMYDDIVSRYGAKSISDDNVKALQYGKGWDELHGRLTRFIDNMYAACMPDKDLVLVMHTRGESSKTLGLTRTLETWVKGQSYVIVYTKKVASQGKINYYVDFTGGEDSSVGSRNPLLEEAGILPNDYREILKVFEEYKENKRRFQKMLEWYEKKAGIPKEHYYLWIEHGLGWDRLRLYNSHYNLLLKQGRMHREDVTKLKEFKAEVAEIVAKFGGR